jgi:predicted transposase/invertase (TIGR01784 family)
MTKLVHTLKEDILCKMVFVKHPNLLKKFVARLLGITFENIGDFIITNPEMPPESLGDKFCRFDINMIVNGQRIDLEVQVNPEKGYAERSLYYWARAYSSALPEGEDYTLLPKTIIISIVDFKMFDCVEYHSDIQALEVTRHTLLSDKFGLHFFELPKLPEVVSKDDKLKLWLSLFKAETEEELARIEALEVEEMEQAIQAFRHTAVSPEFKEIERLRSKARHDEAMALRGAEQRGVDKTIEKMRQSGMSEDEINRIVNL